MANKRTRLMWEVYCGRFGGHLFAAYTKAEALKAARAWIRAQDTHGPTISLSDVSPWMHYATGPGDTTYQMDDWAAAS